MNETLSLIMHRHSTRVFRAQAISEADKRAVQEATLRAPTGGNMAPYSVIDVTDQAVKDRLAELCDHQPMIAKAPMVWVFVADMQKWYDWFALDRCAEKSGVELRAPGPGDLDIALQDTLVAAQTAVIAAQSLGIGSCYIGDVVENGERLQELLDLPRFTFPACMLIFGYPQAEGERNLLPRPPKEDMFMENRYHRRTLGELERAYRAHTDLDRKSGRGGSHAEALYRRKYTSAFMAEMNRSVAMWLGRWTHGDQSDNG